jgi:drug/metabolite transporter (DMT)-like permease
MILGALVLDEIITVLDVIGMVLVIAGAILASRPDRRAVATV